MAELVIHRAQGDTHDLELTLHIDGAADTDADTGNGASAALNVKYAGREKMLFRRLAASTLSSGVATFAMSTLDADAWGWFDVEVQVTYSDSKTRTFPNRDANKARLYLRRQLS